MKKLKLSTTSRLTFTKQCLLNEGNVAKQVEEFNVPDKYYNKKHVSMKNLNRNGLKFGLICAMI